MTIIARSNVSARNGRRRPSPRTHSNEPLVRAILSMAVSESRATTGLVSQRSFAKRPVPAPMSRTRSRFRRPPLHLAPSRRPSRRSRSPCGVRPLGPKLPAQASLDGRDFRVELAGHALAVVDLDDRRDPLAVFHHGLVAARDEGENLVERSLDDGPHLSHAVRETAAVHDVHGPRDMFSDAHAPPDRSDTEFRDGHRSTSASSLVASLLQLVWRWTIRDAPRTTTEFVPTRRRTASSGFAGLSR